MRFVPTLLILITIVSLHVVIASSVKIVERNENGNENTAIAELDNDYLPCLSSVSSFISQFDLHSSISSVSFYYRSKNLFMNYDIPYVDDMYFFPQSGFHLLVEHTTDVLDTNAMDNLRVIIQKSIGELNTNSFWDILLKEGSSSLRTKDWIIGKQEKGIPSSYFFIGLNDETHLLKKPIPNFNDRTVNVRNVHSISSTIKRVSSNEIHFEIKVNEIMKNTDKKTTFKLDNLNPNGLLLDIIYSCNNNGEICKRDMIKIKDNNIVIEEVQEDYSQTTASVKREIIGSGFHRNLKSTVKIQNNQDQYNGCSIMLIERLSNSFFVDQYQVDERFKFGDPTQVLLDHTIDLEKPCYESSPNVILTIQKLSNVNEEIVFELPIHYRYQLPSDSNPFVEAPIFSPSVFVKCNSNAKWNLITNNNQEILNIEIPTGLTTHSNLVINGTLLITCIGALISLIMILKN